MVGGYLNKLFQLHRFYNVEWEDYFKYVNKQDNVKRSGCDLFKALWQNFQWRLGKPRKPLVWLAGIQTKSIDFPNMKHECEPLYRNVQSSLDISILVLSIVTPCSLIGSYQGPSETLVTTYKTTQSHNPQDHKRHFHAVKT
jgi:hypothetical protein